MDKVHDRGRLDWMVELAGATIPATAAALAAVWLAPVEGWATGNAMLVGFGGTFAMAFAMLRLVPPEARRLALPEFQIAPLEADELLLDDVVTDDELLLNRVYAGVDELLLDEPMRGRLQLDAVAELLLDDPLLVPPADSRVVQLFADDRMPSAGQLKQRIDRHLAAGERPAASRDASDALTDALAELRRSMRHG